MQSLLYKCSPLPGSLPYSCWIWGDIVYIVDDVDIVYNVYIVKIVDIFDIVETVEAIGGSYLDNLKNLT